MNGVCFGGLRTFSGSVWIHRDTLMCSTNWWINCCQHFQWKIKRFPMIQCSTGDSSISSEWTGPGPLQDALGTWVKGPERRGVDWNAQCWEDLLVGALWRAALVIGPQLGIEVWKPASASSHSLTAIIIGVFSHWSVNRVTPCFTRYIHEFT
jgi:hypothetical protein